MKVLNGVFDEDEAYIRDLSAAFPEIDIVTATTPEDQKLHIRDAEVFHGFLTEELLAEARQLRWFHLPGAGIDGTLEVPGFAESDVILTSARGPHAPSMANHAMAMVLNLAHKWHDFFLHEQERTWDPWHYVWQYLDLDGRIMGILALGDVGMALSRRAHGFGMKVYAVDKHPKPYMTEVEATWGLDRLDEMVSISDWLVVAAPLTQGTRGLIDRRRLELLPEGAHVIIISRGGIVDEKALIDGLQSGRIAGAGIDAFEEEPLAPESPLWSMPNVVITPHVAGVSAGVLVGLKAIFKENLRRYLAGEDFLYVCDKKEGF